MHVNDQLGETQLSANCVKSPQQLDAAYLLPCFKLPGLGNTLQVTTRMLVSTMQGVLQGLRSGRFWHALLAETAIALQTSGRESERPTRLAICSQLPFLRLAPLHAVLVIRPHPQEASIGQSEASFLRLYPETACGGQRFVLSAACL